LFTYLFNKSHKVTFSAYSFVSNNASDCPNAGIVKTESVRKVIIDLRTVIKTCRQRQTAFRSSGIGSTGVDLDSKIDKMFFSLIVALQPLLGKATVVGSLEVRPHH
jgi:hypothetical protein